MLQILKGLYLAYKVKKYEKKIKEITEQRAVLKEGQLKYTAMYEESRKKYNSHSKAI